MLENPAVKGSTFITQRVTQRLISSEDPEKDQYRNIVLPPSEYQRYKESYMRIFNREPTEMQLKMYYYSVRTGRQ